MKSFFNVVGNCWVGEKRIQYLRHVDKNLLNYKAFTIKDADGNSKTIGNIDDIDVYMAIIVCYDCKEVGYDQPSYDIDNMTLEEIEKLEMNLDMEQKYYSVDIVDDNYYKLVFMYVYRNELYYIDFSEVYEIMDDEFFGIQQSKYGHHYYAPNMSTVKYAVKVDNNAIDGPRNIYNSNETKITQKYWSDVKYSYILFDRMIDYETRGMVIVGDSKCVTFDV